MAKVKMTMRAVGEHVLVRRLPRETVSPGGIALPDNAPEGTTRCGVVVSVGVGKMWPDGTRESIAVRVGQTVWYRPFDATLAPTTRAFTDEDETLEVVRQDALLAVEA